MNRASSAWGMKFYVSLNLNGDEPGPGASLVNLCLYKSVADLRSLRYPRVLGAVCGGWMLSLHCWVTLDVPE